MFSELRVENAKMTFYTPKSLFSLLPLMMTFENNGAQPHRKLNIGWGWGWGGLLALSSEGIRATKTFSHCDSQHQVCL